MSELFQAVIASEEKTDLGQFVSDLRVLGNKYLLRNDIVNAFSAYCTKYEKPEQFHQSSHLSKLIYYVQEIILEDDSLCILLRPKIATMEILRVADDLTVEQMTVQELLDVCDRFVNHFHPQEGAILELDFGPFYDYSPIIRDPKNIGKGVQFLNRYLSSKLFQDPRESQETLFNFLGIHRYNGVQLLINDRIKSQEQLLEQVKKALTFVSELSQEEPYERFRLVLQMMGLEAGWGNTAARVHETLGLLDELIDFPEPQTVEAFISRIPMIFKIVLVSPHGWFGQEGVLGRPDTGGQVVYVLDQAKSLEKQLQEDIHLAGLDSLGVKPKVIILTRLIPNSDGTRCNERLEKVHDTENAWILRVPFREFNPKLTQNWISRFEIWPYLETYAIDAEKELLAEFHLDNALIRRRCIEGIASSGTSECRGSAPFAVQWSRHCAGVSPSGDQNAQRSISRPLLTCRRPCLSPCRNGGQYTNGVDGQQLRRAHTQRSPPFGDSGSESAKLSRMIKYDRPANAHRLSGDFRGTEARVLANRIPSQHRPAPARHSEGRCRCRRTRRTSGGARRTIAAYASTASACCSTWGSAWVSCGCSDDRYVLDKVGHFLLNDEMTQVNMNFVADVCYEAMGRSRVRRARRAARPRALRRLADAVSRAHAAGRACTDELVSLRSFLFVACLRGRADIVFATKPRHLLDIGGNAGVWARRARSATPPCASRSSTFPSRFARLAEHRGIGGQQHASVTMPWTCSTRATLPAGADTIWMSQFLDCFSEEQILAILHAQRAAWGRRFRLRARAPLRSATARRRRVQPQRDVAVLHVHRQRRQPHVPRRRSATPDSRSRAARGGRARQPRPRPHAAALREARLGVTAAKTPAVPWSGRFAFWCGCMPDSLRARRPTPEVLIGKLSREPPATIAFAEVRFSLAAGGAAHRLGRAQYLGAGSFDRRVTTPYRESTRFADSPCASSATASRRARSL